MSKRAIGARRGLLALAGAAVLGLAGCGQGSAAAPSHPAGATAKPALRTVTFRLDWIPVGYEAPFVYGVTHGIYRRYGLDVKWGWGDGSAAAVKYVDTGKVMFADGDANTVLDVDAAGGHVKMVLGFIQDNPDSVIVPVNSRIRTLKQLKGASIAASPGSSTELLLPALLHAAGLTTKDVHIDNMSAAAKTLALLNGRVDAEINYGFETQPELAAKGLNTRLINYADYGVNPIDLGIVTSDQLIKTHPGLVKAFVAATQASILAAEKHPRAAEAAVIAHANGTAPPMKILLEQWQAAEKLLQTPNDIGHPVGWMSTKDWQETEQLYRQYLGLKEQVPLSQAFTDQFVPTAPAAGG
jgi:NitT/TauT family transport system substrate-binding protein